MIYLVKSRFTDLHVVIKAKCNTSQRWAGIYGQNPHYYYNGIDEDKGKSFNSRQIVDKTTSNNKNFAHNKWAEYLI